MAVLRKIGTFIVAELTRQGELRHKTGIYE